MATATDTHTDLAEPTEPAATVAVQLRSIPLSAIVVLEGTNPRGEIVEDAELHQMAATMRERGCLQTVRVRATGEGEYVLIAGGRRYRAAGLACLTEIPAVVLPPGTGADGEQLEALTDALIENELRSPLNALQRAQVYQAMIDLGQSVRRVAERLGGKTQRRSREKSVKEHLTILALPEQLRDLVAEEKIPLKAIKALAQVAAIHEDLACNAAAAVLDVDEHDEAYTWDEVIEHPLAVAVNGEHQLPAGLFHSGMSYPLNAFSLSEKATKNLAAYQKLTGGQITAIRFSQELREQANILGAAHAIDDWHSLIVGQDVADQLAEDYIAETLKQTRARHRREREYQTAHSASTGHTPNGDGPDGEQENTLERAREEASQVRRERQQQRDSAVSLNLDLGLLAFKHLMKIKVDERVLRILASVDVGGELRGLALTGARLALPSWLNETEQANGNTKTVYIEAGEAEAKAREFLEGARSASDIAGRALTLIALADLADERALTQSQASGYTLRFNGPWATQAEHDLHAIVRERIKEGQSPALDELLAKRIAEDEHEARQEAEAAKASLRLDGIIERLAELTDDELDLAAADAELAWGRYTPRTFQLTNKIKALREQRASATEDLQASPEESETSEPTEQEQHAEPLAA